MNGRLELLFVGTADDGPHPREALGLHAHGLAWVHRVSAPEALPTAVAGSFDCALVDLPGIAGLDFVASLRRAAPGLPVIVLSRTDDAALRREALRRGAQDVLPTSRLHPRTTLRAIEHAIERQQVWSGLAQQQARRLAQTDRLSTLGRIAGGIAHELNNPLALLAANLEFLRARNGHVAAAEPLDGLFNDCRDAIDRIHTTVTDLRACAHIAKEELENVDLREVAEVACAELSGPSSAAVIVKRLGVVPMLVGHRGKLTQVAIALLTNALEALPAAAGAGRIVVSTRTEDDHVVLTVEDSGHGIAEDLREQIFDPFFHGPKGAGRGMGLALASEIVRVHHGEIRVESEVGVGSRFEVRIPIESAAAAPPRVAPPPAPKAVPGTRRRILLVDDEPAFLRAMARLLGRHYDVTTAGSGTEALALDPLRFDAIVCDVMMPSMDGPTFYARLVELEPKAKDLVVFVTGGAFRDDARRFIEQVPNPVLHKPFSMLELCDVLDRLFHTKRPTTQVTIVAS